MSQTGMILKNGPVTLKKIPLAVAYILRETLSLPLCLAERLFYSGSVNRQVIDPCPVFILGHWRSGTTYLHELLSKDTRFGYINFYKALFPCSFLITENLLKRPLNSLARIAKLKIPFFNNIPFDFDYPCEEDTALVNMGSTGSAYWAYVFPKKAGMYFSSSMNFEKCPYSSDNFFLKDYLFLLRKLSLKFKGQPLLLKSPPNTCRIKLLLQLFPKAKFVYIHRPPAEIYYSHHKLWKQNLKHYALQKMTGQELHEVITETMRKVLIQYEEDKKLIHPGNLFELSYDQLRQEPVEVIKAIYKQLDLPGYQEAEPAFVAHALKSQDYKPFTYKSNQGLDEELKGLLQSTIQPLAD